jgi:hypothetical protein
MEIGRQYEDLMKTLVQQLQFRSLENSGGNAMSNQGWKFWIVPLTLWGLYSCWYCGYQSGYADGHETAWSMSRPTNLYRELAQNDGMTESRSSELMPVSANQ